jgi:hypothetical protein
MQSDKTVIQWRRCRRKQQVQAVYSCLFSACGVPTGGSSKRLFCFLCNPQSGLANGPMSGLHSYTDGIAVATPMPVAFHSDHRNEQNKPTADGPRYGCSIKGIWRSACSSPTGWLKSLRSGDSGSRYACNHLLDLTRPTVYDAGVYDKGTHHG